jgi:ferritin-like metal-binding protein YciE
MADKNSVQDSLVEGVKDLYSAEKQLTKAISKMAKGSTDRDLEAECHSKHKATSR